MTLPHVVAISGRTGWFIDRVDLHMSNRLMRSWPGADAGGGEALPREWLEPGEYIQSVTQHNHQVGHCGSMLKFNLSSGRSITISGSRGNKKTKNVQHL